MRNAHAYLGLGSNQGDRAARIQEAVRRLQRAPGCRVERLSGVYETEPVGPVPQGWFLNAVAACQTQLDPFALLRPAKAIEAEMGRREGQRWGPRPIDIDLLIYEDVELHTADLDLPHPEMWNRRFVLVPLQDVLPPGPLRSRVEEQLDTLIKPGRLVRPYGPGL